MPNLFGVLQDFGVTDLIDVALVSILLYLLLVALIQTRKTFVIAGVVVFTIVYVITIAFDLSLSRHLLQLVVAVASLAMVVMFHEELRLSAERLLSWRYQWRRHGVTEDPVSSDIVETLIATLTDFARERIGALIVVPGRDSPARFMQGGNRLDGILSEALLKSIFDANSIGHDGAVILTGNRIERFACHLPLSSNSTSLGKRGTRHAAAIGLSEKTDSLCIAVSEERGTISIARHGELQEIAELGLLREVLSMFYREINPVQQPTLWTDGLLRNLRLKAASVLIAMLLWFLVVHEGVTEYRSYTVDLTLVGHDNPSGLIDPARVQVILSGPRRQFYWIDESDLKVNVPAVIPSSIPQDITLTATNVELPEGLTFVNLLPRSISVTLSE